MDFMTVLMDRKKTEIAEEKLAKLQREKSSLVDLASKAVLNCILDGRIIGPQLASLPNKLRDDLMRVFEGQMCLPGHQSIEEFDRRFEAFKSLLPANKIDLQALMSFCPINSETRKRMFSKVMELIETKSPKVEWLRIDLNRITSSERPFQISLLRDLKNLKKLETQGFHILLADLQVLCREKMPNLQHVQVERIFISLRDLKNEELLVKSLFNLRVLLFKEKVLPPNYLYSEYQNLFERLCMDRLPNLKVFKEMADITAGENSTMKFKMGDMVRKSLQHLTTAQGMKDMHLMFPSVTHLRVDKMNEEKDWINLLQFPKIESLQICYSPSKVIEPFLTRYGANLRTLVLSEMEGVLFRQIFKLCPDLEVLKLRNVIVDDDTKLISGFAKLKQLYWKPADVSDESKKSILSNILAAPDLETLEIFGKNFNQRDIENVSGLILNGKILQNLVRFNYAGKRPYLPFLDNDDEEFTDFFLAMSRLIKNSIAFIPKLSDVSVFMCYGCFSWDNMYEGTQIEDMEPYPSYCMCLRDSVCKKLKDETIFDFLEALKRRK